MCANEDEAAAQCLQNNSISKWYKSSLFTVYLTSFFERICNMSCGNDTVVFLSSQVDNISSYFSVIREQFPQNIKNSNIHEGDYKVMKICN